MRYLSGPTICRLMRRHRVTIRLLAQRLDTTMQRVRVCRQQGITDRHVARDWVEAITGKDPGRLQEPICLDNPEEKRCCDFTHGANC